MDEIISTQSPDINETYHTRSLEPPPGITRIEPRTVSTCVGPVFYAKFCIFFCSTKSNDRFAGGL